MNKHIEIWNIARELKLGTEFYKRLNNIMNKKEFNNWLQKCKIDKDGKYTSLLSTDCLYEFYKEATKEQFRLCGGK